MTRATPLKISAVAGLIAVAVFVVGLGEHGVWSQDELLVLDRSRAALGEGAAGLTRSPWLPDALRTWALDTLGGAAGLRLPHALAGSGLVAVAAGVARWRGMSPSTAMLAGALALAFPILGASSRTALGNPIGELLVALSLISALAALRTTVRSRAAAAAIGSLLLAAAAVSAVGLGLGLCVPLATLATLAVSRHLGVGAQVARPIQRVLVASAVVALGVTVMLSMRQGDGFVPILGASKSLELLDKPQLRRFAAGFEDFGHQLFPWTPLVVIGALSSDRDRLGPAWLACAVVGTVAWSVVYGPLGAPVVIPAALCGATVIERLARQQTPAVWRRLAIAAAIGGILVLGKDAQLSPERILAPLSEFPGGHNFPAEALSASERLGATRSIAALALLAVGLCTARHGWLGTLANRIPSAQRSNVAHAVIIAAALTISVQYNRGVIPALSALVSPRAVLAKYEAWKDAGELPDHLGTHRVRDRGLALYGPGNVEVLGSRRDATQWLSADEPRVALIRKRDLAPIHQDHRHQRWPLYVLDDSHAHLYLVANVLPAGATDLNPIPTVLLDDAPQLANETMVRFENYIELIGWQVTEPIVRGREATVEIAIRVLRPLPAGCKLYTRMLKGRSSRMAIEAQPLAMGVYPPNLWREGDFIRHRYTFKAPPLEIQWGAHELVVGLRRSEKKNLLITVPEKKNGDFGVRVRDKKRNFATLGTVQVY